MASGLLSLKWNNHRSTFFHILSTVRQKENYCDVTLACDGKLYPVHKLVLSTCSEYFELMFDNAHCKHPFVVLKDVKSEDLEALLNYMYIGEVNVLQDKLPSLIKAAECLQIKGLAVPDEEPVSRDNKRVHRIEESPQPKRRKSEGRDEDSRYNSRISSKSHSRDLTNDNVNSSEKQSSNSVNNNNSARSMKSDITSNLDDRGGSENGDSSSKDNKSNSTTSQKQFHNVPEVVLDEREVKAEPLDEAMDDKETLHSDLGFDALTEGADGSMGDGSSGYIDEQLLAGSVSQSVDDVGSLPGSSGFQAGSFTMWEGEGSLQGFPTEGGGYSGDGSQNRQMIKNAEDETNKILQELQLTEKDDSDPSSPIFIMPELIIKETGGSGVRDEKPVVCPYCSYRASVKSVMQCHLRTHTGEKPYPCKHCPYRASSKSNLTIHLRNHLEKKSFTCPNCTFSTDNRASVTRHISLHNSNHSCPHCSYNCDDKDVLLKHVLIHMR